MAKNFSVSYKPEPWTKSEYVLGCYEDQPTALKAAAEYAQLYYGKRSPIFVRDGRRKIHTIPAGSALT